MRTKPGAGFSFQPTNTLFVSKTPSVPPSPRKGEDSHNDAAISPKTKQKLTESVYNLARSTTAAPPPSLLLNTKATMTRSRSASFSDDDLIIVSSQAISSQGYGSQSFGSQSQLHAASQQLGGFGLDDDDDSGGRGNGGIDAPLKPQFNDAIGITPSIPNPGTAAPTKAGHHSNSTAHPVFGQPTQMASPTAPLVREAALSMAKLMVQRKQNLFNANPNRPEHHRPQRLTGPLAPAKSKNKPPAARPVFSSFGSSQPAGGTVYPASSYYSSVTKVGSATDTNIPGATNSMYGDVEVYTDPGKAQADLKALLEGGMEDDEEEEEEEEQVSTKAVPSTTIGAKPSVTEPKKMTKKAGQYYKDGTVPGINVKLLPHQVEGVKWMRGRELGPVKRGRVPKGGILADDMGLGKTLQSLSLIVTNPKPAVDAPGWKKHYERIDGATLVVAPLALIRQWEAEIKEKVSADRPLRVRVHHGPQRTVRPKELAQFDVVITTYQILVSEHGHSNESLKSGCFGLHWYRVILDEAHSIKNRNAKMTKACCALSAEFRWCLTGTPMQNNLDELQSLVNFLHITPYNNLADWRAHIDAPMKNGRGALAIRRLHSLLQCFMKRRTKDILREEGALVPGGKEAVDAAAAEAAAKVQGATVDTAEKGTALQSNTTASTSTAAPKFKITQRNVVNVVTEFTPAERSFYDRLEARADKSLEKMMKGKSMSYASALVLLLRLRQTCNHPNLLNVKLDKDRDAMSTDPVSVTSQSRGATTEGDMDALVGALGGLGIQAKKCEVCMMDLTKEEQSACDASGDGLLCTACVEDRGRFEEAKASGVKRNDKSKKSKKKKNDRHRGGNGDENADDVVSTLRAKRKPRNRRAVMDSDDEEADGSWLVGEEEGRALRLGTAGGQEDEDAEGNGDWLKSEAESEDETDASQLSSFVVDDGKGTDLAEGKTRKPVIGDESEEESSDSSRDSESESESESESDSDGDSGISESEYLTAIDNRMYLKSSKRWTQGNGTRRSSSSKIMASAKIRKMLELLQAEAAEHKFIVFSQFTSMLDLLEPFLRKAKLGFVRYDGGMRNDAREASLHSLRNSAQTRVLLCSLKCGSLGLNLTAATRVVILEPFWNPFVEEQAIDRVHRLTQTVDVTVYKLTVEGTIEQRIQELQEKKRLLAAHALEGGSLGGRGRKGKKDELKLGLQELLDLFKHSDRDGAGAGAGAGADAVAVDRHETPGMGTGVAENVMFMSGGGARMRRQASEQDAAYDRRW